MSGVSGLTARQEAAYERAARVHVLKAINILKGARRDLAASDVRRQKEYVGFALVELDGAIDRLNVASMRLVRNDV